MEADRSRSAAARQTSSALQFWHARRAHGLPRVLKLSLRSAPSHALEQARNQSAARGRILFAAVAPVEIFAVSDVPRVRPRAENARTDQQKCPSGPGLGHQRKPDPRQDLE